MGLGGIVASSDWVSAEKQVPGKVEGMSECDVGSVRPFGLGCAPRKLTDASFPAGVAEKVSH